MFFNIVVKLLSDIDVVKQQFAVSFVLNFQWMLSKDDSDKWQENPAEFEAQWQPPAVEVTNAIDLSVTASKVQTVTGTFKEVMELQNFPFDCLEFTLTMVFPQDEQVLELHPAIDQPECVRMVQDKGTLPEYHMSSPVLELGHTTQNCRKTSPTRLNLKLGRFDTTQIRCTRFMPVSVL